GRQVPVVEGGDGGDAGGEQRVHQPPVEVEAALVDGAGAARQHARPGDGEAVGGEAEVPHQRDVRLHAAVVVAGDVAGVAVAHGVRRVGEAVPDARAGTVGERRALDLVGGGGGAPEEAVGE